MFARPRRTSSRPLFPALPALAALALAVVAVPPASSQDTATTPVASSGWVEGQLCWAFYEPHMAWYASHVVSVTADSVRIRHFDGFEDTVVPIRVRPDRVAVGDSLSGWYIDAEGEGNWYTAVVVERRGMEITIEYSDGEQSRTWLRWIRIKDEAPSGG
jgi:hypothetical protein